MCYQMLVKDIGLAVSTRKTKYMEIGHRDMEQMNISLKGLIFIKKRKTLNMAL